VKEAIVMTDSQMDQARCSKLLLAVIIALLALVVLAILTAPDALDKMASTLLRAG